MVTLTRYHGDTALLALVLTNPDTGLPYDPASSVLIFSLKRHAYLPDEEALVQKISTVGGFTIDNGPAGEITVELVPDDWAALRPHVAYEFDVSAQDNDTGAPRTVARGQLTVASDVTRGLTLSVPTHTTNPSGGGLGSGTVTSVDITAPAAGITASGGPITTGGAITLALANDLAALEGLGSTGFAVRTTTDTWAQRTIAGTTDKIDVTNGNGVSGNPTLSISATYAGQGSITTLGTIATGVWAGTAVAVNHGGTGQTSYTDGQLLIGNSSGNTLTKATLTAGDNITITNAGGSITIASTGGGGGSGLPGSPATGDITYFDGAVWVSLSVGSDDDVLTLASGLPSWAAASGGGGSGTVTSVNLTQPAAGITVSGGPVTVSGSITLALANDLAALEGLGSTGIAVRTGTDAWAQRTITGTADKIDVTNGNGVSGNPTLSISATYLGQGSITTLGTIATGVWAGTAVAVNHGGTGQTSYTDGQLLIGNSSGNTLTKATLTQGSNITITNGGGSITIAASGGMTNPMTTAGDLIVGGSGGTPARLAKGSDGQVLKMVSGSIAWGTDSTGSGSLPGSPAAGDITYYDGSNWVSLAKGSDGQFLKLASGLPSWAAGGGGGGSSEDFSFQRATSQTISDNTSTPISFATKNWDTATRWASSPNPTRVTFSSDDVGRWHISAAVYWPSNATGVRFIEILKNGSPLTPPIGVGLSPTSSSTPVHTCDGYVDVADGDYIEFTVYHNAGTTLDVTARFQGSQV